LLLDTADGPGIGYHSGRYSCRLYCDVVGRHKVVCGNYYPVLLKPDDYSVPRMRSRGHRRGEWLF
ncbi:hypothetical protein B0H13DRAFT_1647669, partial [Mycena leptocephala]